MNEPPSFRIDPGNLPRHVAIIMDGNGRWAKLRNMPRTQGHREGLTAAKRVVKAASDLRIPYLSLFTFSTENWKRAADEVSFLMLLLQQHLRREFDFYRENGIRVVHSGDLEGLPREVRQEILLVMKNTESFPGLTVNLAINYGGRDEVVRAIRRWTRSGDAGEGETSPELSEQSLRAYLDTDLPDPDLLVRTGGEKRISNFLIWQSAYAELYFSEKLWPDWDGEDLFTAIHDFQGRERRFGGVT